MEPVRAPPLLSAVVDRNVEIELLPPGNGVDASIDDVWHVLSVVDEEFVPPLSARTDSLSMELRSDLTQPLTPESMFNGPVTYFESSRSEFTLIARVDGKVAGILGFLPDYHDPHLPGLSDLGPTTRVTTIAVLPNHRRSGVATALEAALADLPEPSLRPTVTVRTWSTNRKALGLFRKRGYGALLHLPDDRGPGISTVYLSRSA